MTEPNAPEPSPLIEFLPLTALREVCPPPFPASRGVPDWLKAMPPERPGGPGGGPALTLKKCPPFIEAVTLGYLVPLASEVRFTRDAEGGLHFEAELNVVGSQFPPQYIGSPMEGSLVVKFLNPWVVRTPPGYSTLVLPALNRYHMPFSVLAGVVETDTYYREINFPAVCLMPNDTNVTLPRGTPIAQLLPFRREAWSHALGLTDIERRTAVEERFMTDTHLYKDEHWKKKTFG